MLLAGTGSGIYGLSPSGEATAFALEGEGVGAVGVVGGTVLAGVRGKGLLRSDDGGRTWAAVLEGIDVRSIATRSDGTVYVGASPVALYHSTDGGGSFEELSQVRALPGYPGWNFPNPPHQGNVRGLALGRTAAYAAVEVGGVIASQDDGKTWSEMREGLHPDVHTVACAPVDGPDLLYAATGQGFFRSRDAGVSWEAADNGLRTLYLTPVAVHPQRPELAFTAGTEGRPRYWRGREGGARATIYRTTDGACSWEVVEDGLPGAVEVLAVDPERPDTVYAGTGDGKVLVSDSQGASWRMLAQGLPPVHRFAFMP